MNKGTSKTQIAIIGTGIVGLCAAYAVAKTGAKVCILAPKSQINDQRSTAFMMGSVEYLEALGLWQSLLPHSYPLNIMRILDDTKRLIRAPQTDFKASEIGLPAFGYNILNKAIIEQLQNALNKLQNVSYVEKRVKHVQTDIDQDAQITFEDESKLSAEFVIGADGRNSIVREALQIETRKWQYPQIALVGNFSHALPHDNISTEFHTQTGPFTLVPLSKIGKPNMSSFVCVEDADGAAKLMQLSKNELALELEKRMQSILGKVTLETNLQQFPLSGLVAKQFSKDNVALIGEAAHAFPPIGAQGLNLGIRDIKNITQCITQRLAENDNLAEAAKQYNAQRAVDINTRTLSVDLLNRSLLSNHLPVQATRSFALYALGAFEPFKKLAMNEGISPGRIFTKLNILNKR
ncbi:MAG: UbiH/UbiF family hydroxylase [Nitratireductor sp.]